MDEAERREIQRQVQSLAARSIRSFEQHTAVHRLMADQGIPYCILKGVASAWYYPDRLARQMGMLIFLWRVLILPARRESWKRMDLRPKVWDMCTM